VTQLIQFKAFFPDLDIVTEEENGGEEAKSQEIKSNLKAFLVDSEVASFGSLLAKDKDIKVIFIQNNLLVSLIHKLYRLLEHPSYLIPKLTLPCQGFFCAPFSRLSYAFNFVNLKAKNMPREGSIKLVP
jgi:hypothetical protein